MGLYRLQFNFFKKAKDFDKISQVICHLPRKFQINWKIMLNFGAFLENLNFMCCSIRVRIFIRLGLTIYSLRTLFLMIKKSKKIAENLIRSCITFIRDFWGTLNSLCARTHWHDFHLSELLENDYYIRTS